MKKMFVMLVAMLTMAICSVCSATPGKVLDAEDAMVAKLFAAKDYKAVEAFFTPEFKKDFDAKSFDNFKNSLGALTKSRMLSLEKFDEADQVVYLTAFEKMPDLVYAFIFEVKNEKPLIAGMQFRPLKAEQPQAAGK